MSAVVAKMTIRPTSGRFLRDKDLVGKMDPFIKVTFDKSTKATDVAENMGKFPTWNTDLQFNVTEDQMNRKEIHIVLEAYDQDPSGKSEYIGIGKILFSAIRDVEELSDTVEILDSKGNQQGTIQVECTLRLGADSPGSKNRANVSEQGLGKGTLIVRPIMATLQRNTEMIGNMDPYVVVILNEQAFMTNVAESGGKQPTWKDALSFELKGGEEFMVFRVMDSDRGTADDLIGEALINMEYLAGMFVGDGAELQIPLEYKKKTVGQLTLEFEYFPDVFDCPVKFYGPIDIKRGDYICKKIKYSNPDNMKKTLKILTADQTNLVQSRGSEFIINPRGYTEIRFKIYAPSRSIEATARLDIFVEELGKVEESLVFKLRAP